MSTIATITFDDLVTAVLDDSTASTDGECFTCRAQAGEPCTLKCDQRGKKAMKAVSILVGDLPRDQFEEVLKVSRERAARDDEAPGFFWAWWAVDTEAEERGMYPVGL